MNEVFDRERVRGFMHNDQGIMRNGSGEEVILRGWGVGNWDNPEGFMLGVHRISMLGRLVFLFLVSSKTTVVFSIIKTFFLC